MYCKCGNKIPDVRVKAGYKTCVKCSTEEKWGCSQLIYHKTGNTIEVIKDRELCEQINAMAKRPGFGVCVGVKGTIKRKAARKAEPRKIRKIETPLTFQEIGAKALTLDNESAQKFLDNCVNKKWISQYSAKRILTIVEAL